MENETLNQIANVAKQQYESCLMFKQPRMEEIAKSIDAYYNRVPLAPKGYRQVPVPVMSGYVNTLQAKIDDPVRLKFTPSKTADYLSSKRLQALWEIDKSEQKANYNQVDRWVKKNAIFSGLGIYKVFSESDPEYAHHLEPVDYYDFVFEPMGGGDIQKHLFKGQGNIYRTASELKNSADLGWYDKNQVSKLLTFGDNNKELSSDVNVEQNKAKRYSILNLDPRLQAGIGDKIYSFVEMVTRWKDGKDWYVFFECQTGVWIKCCPITELFKTGRSPWVVWQIDEDANTLLCKAPADDILPIHDAIRMNINDALNNVLKRTYPQRAFDKDMVVDAALLQFKRDGLIPMDTKGGQRALSAGTMTFEIPDTAKMSLDLASYLDNFLGTKVGITSSMQGTSEEEKVGIYFGNLQQTADRIGLLNKSYKKAHADIGIRWIDGVREHLTEKIAVKTLGETNVEYCVKEDANPDYDIVVESTTEAERIKEVTTRMRKDTLQAISMNQGLVQLLNPKKIIEEQLINAGFNQGEVKEFMDTDFYGQKEIISRAASAAQSIKENKKPQDYKQANEIFCQSFAEQADNLDLNEKQKPIAEEYLLKHLGYAYENAIRKANIDAMNDEIDQMKKSFNQPMQPIQPMQPMPNQPMPESNPQEEIAEPLMQNV